MQIFGAKKSHNIVRILCAAIILAMMAISFVVYHASISKFAIFILFLLFFVLLPGNVILDAIKLPTRHISERILIGLFAGWALVVAEYFICDITHISFLYYANLLLCAYYFYSRFKAGFTPKKALEKSFDCFFRIPVAFYVFVVIVLLYVLLLTQYKYLAPGTGLAIFSTSDKAFQMGIVNSLVNDFPAANPWVDGMVIHYHIFSQVLYAVAIILFPCLTSDYIIMSCGPYLLVFTLGVALYAMFRRFCKRKDLAGVYTLLVALSHPFVARSPIKSYIFRILLVNDNYAGYGIAAAIAWIITLDIYYKDAKQNKLPIALLSIAEITLLAGIKAPMALVMLGGLLGTLILAAIMKEARLTDIGILAGSGISFALIYKVLLVSSNSIAGSSSSVISFAKINNMCFWKKPLIDFLAGLHISGVARLSIIMLVFFITFFSIFFFPMCVGYIREVVLVISRKKKFDIPRITIYAATLVGTILTLLMNYSGHSQIYFGIVAFIFSSIIAFWFFEDVSTASARWMQFIRKACICLFAITLLVSVTTMGTYMKTNAAAAIKNAHPETQFKPYRSLNLDELEAMNWIKDNAPEDALLATQMYSTVPHEQYNVENRYQNCHFLYAVYSCRNFYIEGSGFSIDSSNLQLRKKMIAINDQLYDATNEDRGALADSLGIDYVVVTKFVEGPLDLDNEDYVKCFSNDTIDIYEIK